MDFRTENRRICGFGRGPGAGPPVGGAPGAALVGWAWDGRPSAAAQMAARANRYFFLIIVITLYKRFSSKDDGFVSKPVLGRKLGALLKEEADKEVNPTLLRGHIPVFSRAEPSASSEQEQANGREDAEAPTRAAIPVWYWLGADLLLVALALAIAFKGAAPVSATRRIVAVGVVVLGGVLAVWALRGQEKK
jgi:hypothetical protein